MILANAERLFGRTTLLELDLEYRLTVATRLVTDDCSCGEYLVNRWAALLPAILAKALDNNESPVNTFVGYVTRLHERRCENTIQGE